MQEDQQQKPEEFDLEIIQARITDKLNQTTGHEPHDFHIKASMVERELGSYMVRALCDKTTEKVNGVITVKWVANVDKMKKYLELFGEKKNED